MSAIVERLASEAITGYSDTMAMIGRAELQFEVWFNYMLSKVGEHNLFNKSHIFDDMTFNTDGYEPTLYPVKDQMLEGMCHIGMDFIKPSPWVPIEGDDAEEVETLGSMLASETENMYWVLFTVVEPKHPLKGVRYATAYRNGELIYPPQDPSFTDSYDDEKVHGQARGIFIDVNEKFLKATRPELFKTDRNGKLLP